jgi:hypothetical protein
MCGGPTWMLTLRWSRLSDLKTTPLSIPEPVELGKKLSDVFDRKPERFRLDPTAQLTGCTSHLTIQLIGIFNKNFDTESFILITFTLP